MGSLYRTLSEGIHAFSCACAIAPRRVRGVAEPRSGQALESYPLSFCSMRFFFWKQPGLFRCGDLPGLVSLPPANRWRCQRLVSVSGGSAEAVSAESEVSEAHALRTIGGLAMNLGLQGTVINSLGIRLNSFCGSLPYCICEQK